MSAFALGWSRVPSRMHAFVAEWLARHPEWWSLAIALLAWVPLLLPANQSFAGLICRVPTSGLTGSLTNRLQITLAPSQLLPEFAGWVMMSTAMMLPLIVLPIRHAGFRSFQSRRHRAIGGFALGYLGVWTLAGIVLVPLLAVARLLDVGAGSSLAAGAAVMAGGWQFTPAKFRALRSCHRTIALSPKGWRADADCLRFGCLIGHSCVASCWAIMALAMLLSQSPMSMICLQMLVICERYEARPRVKSLSLALLVCAILVSPIGFTIRVP